MTDSAARRYKEIQRSDFERFLDSICDYAEFDKQHYNFDFNEEVPGKWRRVESQINEYCYYIAVNLDRGYCLKVYSSIERDENISRESGIDAIRVVAANALTAEPIRPAFPIVKRIPGWKKNLHKRFSQVIKSLGINVECPRCKKLLLLRKNKSDNRVFLGCSQYPECKGQRSL